MKKIFAVLLAGTLALSLAACTGSSETSETSDTQSSAASSVAESSAEEESSKQASETSETSKENSAEESNDINKIVDNMKENAGEKSAAALDKIKSETLTFNAAITSKTKDEDGKEKTQNIVFQVVKNGEKASRYTVALGLMSIDILSNEDGVFYMNTSTKKAAKMTTGENSSLDSDSIMSSLTGMLGTDTDINTEDALDKIKNGETNTNSTYEGSAEEEYNGETLTAESYTVTGKNADGKETTAKLKAYFDGDDLKYLTVSGGETELSAEIKSFTNEIDESLLVVPENFEITETSTVSE